MSSLSREPTAVGFAIGSATLTVIPNLSPNRRRAGSRRCCSLPALAHTKHGRTAADEAGSSLNNAHAPASCKSSHERGRGAHNGTAADHLPSLDSVLEDSPSEAAVKVSTYLTIVDNHNLDSPHILSLL